MSALAAIASTSSVLFIRNPYYLSRSKKLPQSSQNSTDWQKLSVVFSGKTADFHRELL
jgi:hypothetical protein